MTGTKKIIVRSWTRKA